MFINLNKRIIFFLMIFFSQIHGIFYFVTGNKGKFEEVAAVWNNVLTPEQLKTYGSLQQKNIDLEEIQEIDPIKVIQAKLDEAHKLHPNATIFIEDTSLYMQALQGKKGTLPGPLIKWFMETIGNEGIVKIAQCFGNVNATAKCIIGLVDDKGTKSFFEGVIDGKIVAPRSTGQGFGWDPIFEPSGQKGVSKTFAQMTASEKNEYSMRGQAAKKLVEYVKKH